MSPNQCHTSVFRISSLGLIQHSSGVRLDPIGAGNLDPRYAMFSEFNTNA